MNAATAVVEHFAYQVLPCSKLRNPSTGRSSSVAIVRLYRSNMCQKRCSRSSIETSHQSHMQEHKAEAECALFIGCCRN